MPTGMGWKGEGGRYMQHAALDGVARAAFRKIASDSVLHCHRHRREGASKA